MPSRTRNQVLQAILDAGYASERDAALQAKAMLSAGASARQLAAALGITSDDVHRLIRRATERKVEVRDGA
jgi:transposase-like protein